MGGIWELLDRKTWEWDLSFKWEWDGNGNEVIEMGGNWYEKSVPAHLYTKVVGVRLLTRLRLMTSSYSHR